ncbi:hypothetical protein [Pseudoalteromonas phenolica]|uniref:hypothetical protein n=1 Tax=Pseudoalteromonas phenolica TaxID=161398 RepID=UPI00207BB589|nr:hypothetical protein [Pseudoalteromonas phenolica]
MLNKNGPVMLDEETRLDSVTAFSSYIIYNNTMINYSVEQLDCQSIYNTAATYCNKTIVQQ